MTKKFVIFAFSVVLCMAVMAGCGKNTEEKKETVKEEKVEAEEVKEEEPEVEEVVEEEPEIEEEVVEEVDPTEEIRTELVNGNWEMIPAQTKNFYMFKEDGTFLYYSGTFPFDEMRLDTFSYKIEGDIIYLHDYQFKVGYHLSELTPDFMESIDLFKDMLDYQDGNIFLYEINYDGKSDGGPSDNYYPRFMYKTQKDLDWL